MREAQAPHEIASITCTASEALAPKFPPKENTLADNMHRIALHLSISYAHFRPRANKVYPRRISQHWLTSDRLCQDRPSREAKFWLFRYTRGGKMREMGLGPATGRM